MAFPRIGGSGIGIGLGAAKTNAITLAATEIYNLPAGTYLIAPGPYTSLQWLDNVSGQWRTISANATEGTRVIDSDGGNFRLANLTGTPVGALITNAGSGLTNGFNTVTVTPSAGSSVWKTVVGGAINSTVTITTAGTNYLFPPILIIDAPPAGGIQATAVCALSGGAINTVTVTNQGAGYSVAPNITIVNDPRDTTGSGGVLTVNATLAGSGTLTAMYPTNPGTVLTAVPTFTFSPASTIAATAVMNFVITGITATTAGTGGGAAQPFSVYFPPAIVAGTRASNVAGPISDTGLTMPRTSWVNGTTTGGGGITATGAVVADAGFGHQAIPNGFTIAGGTGLWTAQPLATAAVGGITDTSWLQPI